MKIKTPIQIDAGCYIKNADGAWLNIDDCKDMVRATNCHQKLCDVIQEMLTAQTIGTERECDRARRLAIDALAEARG